MSPEFDKLLGQVLALPEEYKLWLLTRVDASLAEPMTSDVEEAWAEVVDVRVAEHERGNAVFISAE
jgi:hypothetical protein